MSHLFLWIKLGLLTSLLHLNNKQESKNRGKNLWWSLSPVGWQKHNDQTPLNLWKPLEVFQRAEHPLGRLLVLADMRLEEELFIAFTAWLRARALPRLKVLVPGAQPLYELPPHSHFLWCLSPLWCPVRTWDEGPIASSFLLAFLNFLSFFLKRRLGLSKPIEGLNSGEWKAGVKVPPENPWGPEWLRVWVWYQPMWSTPGFSLP